MWSRDQGRNNAVLEGDESLDGNDLIGWGQGQEIHIIFKEEDGNHFSSCFRLLSLYWSA